MSKYYSCHFCEPNRERETQERELDRVLFLSLRRTQQRQQNGGACAGRSIIPVASSDPTERAKRRSMRWTEYYSCRFNESNRESKTEECALNRVLFLSLLRTQQRQKNRGACAGQSITPTASLNPTEKRKQKTMRWTEYYSCRFFEPNRESKTEEYALDRVLFLSLLRTQQRKQNGKKAVNGPYQKT